MKALLSGLAIALMLLAQPALARPWGFGPQAQGQGARVRPGPPQREQREVRREPRAVPQRDERPNGRLSDEERRELRREVDQANREIYRRNRGR